MRLTVDGNAIGCPVAHYEGPCPMCGGGWPGTKMSSVKLIEAAKNGGIRPEMLGCGVLEQQVAGLLAYYARQLAENET